jgi:hypothetical protein
MIIYDKLWPAPVMEGPDGGVPSSLSSVYSCRDVLYLFVIFITFCDVCTVAVDY